MKNVDYQRKDHQAALKRWELISTISAGKDAIVEAGTDLIPMPRPQDQSPANKLRYKNYLHRGIHFNATAATIAGHVGQIMDTKGEIEMPGNVLPWLQEDVDGNGLSLDQQAREVIAAVDGLGRLLMVTDMPQVSAPITRDQISKGLIRPTIQIYDARKVINWNTRRVGSQTMLSLVVIEEEFADYSQDRFFPKVEPRWRVLSLNDQGVYQIEIYKREKDTKTGETQFVLVEPLLIPTDGSGNPWSYIPADFVGSVNNSPDIDPSPVYTIAEINRGHFQNSCDYEESCHVNGQPTVAISTRLNSEEFKIANGDGVALGSAGGLFLGEDGKAELLQTSPNTMPFEAMQHKERQMIALGARIVQDHQTQRTATEATNENRASNSILATIAKNVSEAYRIHISNAIKFIDGGEPSVESIKFALNDKFDVSVFTEGMITAINASWSLGGISDTEYRNSLRLAKLPLGDDEEWKDQREANPPEGAGVSGLQRQPKREEEQNV